MSNKLLKQLSSEQIKDVAFFGALCLFFSVIEYLIPKPVPFFRLGLANLPILLVLSVFNKRQIALLAVLKIVGQALVNGTLASYIVLFSASGTLLSVALMYLVYHFAHKHISLLGIGIIGALASNLIQVQLSLWFIFGQQAWIIVPLFLGLGLLSGFAVGMAAHVFCAQSTWFKAFCQNKGLPSLVPPLQDSSKLTVEEGSGVRAKSQAAQVRKKTWRLSAKWNFFANNLKPSTMFMWGLVLLFAFVLQENLLFRFFQILVLVLLVLLAGKRIQFIYFLVLALTITFFNLFIPNGKELFVFIGLSITQAALLDGLNKSLAIIGMVFISLATVNKNLKLPGRFGAMLASMFLSYEILMAKRTGIKLKTLIPDIDRLLFEHQTSMDIEQAGSSTKDSNHAQSFPKHRLGASLVAVFITLIVFCIPLALQILPKF